MRSFPALTCVTNGDKINFHVATLKDRVVPAASYFSYFISKLPIVRNMLKESMPHESCGRR
jgi:hypothetical protein